MHAWVNSGERNFIERAHNILTHMQSLRKSGKRPDLIPDAISFTSLITALAQESKRGGNKINAQKMLDSMFELLTNKDGGGDIDFDTVAYNAFIHAQSQSGSASKAEMLLNYMLDQHETSAIRPVRL
jgi:pentatricopeptide repeat protein